MKNDNHVWDNKFPTAQMLGRWQPWHAGHQKLFEEIIKKTGQVNIMVRDVQGVEDNPFDFEEEFHNVCGDILISCLEKGLRKEDSVDIIYRDNDSKSLAEERELQSEGLTISED